MKFDDFRKLLGQAESFIDTAVERLLSSIVPQFS